MRRSIKLGLYGLVLAGLLGGTAAWVNGGKSVDLRIDGQDRRVHTSAANVAGVLAAAHVPVGEHDLVAPDLQSPVKDGAQIVIDRGHLLHLLINGQARDVWVNADSVDEALGQLGYGTQDLVSVSRSKRLDDGVTNLAISSPMKVTFKIAGKSVVVLSAGPTVYQAISDGGIFLAPNDRLSVDGGSTITANEVITVKRVTYGSSVQQVSVPYGNVKQNDPNSYVGTNSVVTPGQNGVSQITYQLVYVDGKLAGKVPTRTIVLSPPVDQKTKVGTKSAPVGAVIPAGAAQQIAAGLVAAHGWGTDQFSCLVSLWSKESGWRTNAANSSGAYGIPQALPGSKMASAGADWQTSAKTQITWGLSYISGVYGTPCAAWAHSQATNWY
ncbi:MAG: ubiquitin-like domain-containing protein [Actinomycetota bacterium]|nr:ubiquitin-like domain-containing protein [Actinomycetota bacterium]MDQ2958519.1 ubiquitin-like domain-containing protein [Actinomycetota bacterium]